MGFRSNYFYFNYFFYSLKITGLSLNSFYESPSNDFTTLWRGGSDTITAVLAVALNIAQVAELVAAEF